ncbi:YfhO family protein [Patescibacteria group bacterium]|nr:YfhO family protein [Patescibacteria group bacterium]
MRISAILDLLVVKILSVKKMKRVGKVKKVVIFFVLMAICTLILLPSLISLSENEIFGVEGDAYQVYSTTFYKDAIKGDSIFEKIFGYKKGIDVPLDLLSLHTYRYMSFKLIGNPLGFNLVWIASFYLTIVAGYLLIKVFTKSDLAAIIGGTLITFVPTHFAFGLGFGGATHIEFIVFFLYFFFSFFQKPKIWKFIGTLVSLAIMVANEHHFAFFSIIFVLVYLCYLCIAKRDILKKVATTNYVIASCIFFLVSCIYLVIFYINLDKVAELQLGIEETVSRSVDVLGFFVPYQFHPIWGDFFSRGITSKFITPVSETTAYLGFVSIFLIIIFFVKSKKKFDYNQKALFLIGFIFLCIALGPLLHLNGLFNPQIRLPYYLVYSFLPIFSSMRAVGRAVIYLEIIAFIFASTGFALLIKKKSIKKQFFYAGAVIILIAIEFLAISPTVSTNYPDFYNKIANEEGNFKILQILNSTSYAYASRALYFNSHHNKTAVGGYTFARPVPGMFQMETGTPVIEDLLYRIPKGEGIDPSLVYDPKEVSNLVLNYNNIKYIVQEKEYISNKNVGPEHQLTPEKFSEIKEYITSNIKGEVVQDDNEIYVFKVKEINNQDMFVSRGIGFKEVPEKHTTKLYKEDGYFYVNNPSDHVRKGYLTFKASARGESRKLSVSFNENDFQDVELGKTENIFSLELGNILPGQNRVKFISPSYNESEIELSDFIIFEDLVNNHGLLSNQSINDTLEFPPTIRSKEGSNQYPKSLLNSDCISSGVACSLLPKNFSEKKGILSDFQYGVNYAKFLQNKGINRIVIHKDRLTLQDLFYAQYFFTFHLKNYELINEDNNTLLYVKDVDAPSLDTSVFVDFSESLEGSESKSLLDHRKLLDTNSLIRLSSEKQIAGNLNVDLFLDTISTKKYQIEVADEQGKILENVLIEPNKPINLSFAVNSSELIRFNILEEDRSPVETVPPVYISNMWFDDSEGIYNYFDSKTLEDNKYNDLVAFKNFAGDISDLSVVTESIGRESKYILFRDPTKQVSFETEVRINDWIGSTIGIGFVKDYGEVKDTISTGVLSMQCSGVRTCSFAGKQFSLKQPLTDNGKLNFSFNDGKVVIKQDGEKVFEDRIEIEAVYGIVFGSFNNTDNLKIDFDLLHFSLFFP